jgi:hypothetical protein
VCVCDDLYTYLVHLDPGHDSLLLKDVDDLLSIDSGLVKRLLEEDSAGDVLSKPWRSDEEGPVRLAVGLRVLETDRGKPLAAGGVRLVHGKDTPSWRRHGFLCAARIIKASSL